MIGPPQVPPKISRYLIQGESLVFLSHRHWIILLEPILTASAGLVIVVLVGSTSPGTPARIAFLVWVLLLLRLAFHFFEWHREVFLATNNRLMLVHGLLTRKVDIMPMTKVTDMRYDRSLIGRIFGYGVFILESAGQDQALSRINFVPHPDLRYQQISAVIFVPSQQKSPIRLSAITNNSTIPISDPDLVWWRHP